MKTRMNYSHANPQAFNAMMELEKYIKQSGLAHNLYELIKLRVSQINGCSYCIDMHARDLLKTGESMERILLLPVWREVPIYSDHERAILELTEYVTRIAEEGLPQDLYDKVLEHVDQKTFMDVIMAINIINSWNRIAISTGMYPGCFD